MTTTETGAGAWLNPRAYKRGMDVSNPRIRAGVRALQWVLDRYGYMPGPLDGIFGLKTEQAAKAYQLNAGLIRDGIIGPKTAKATCLLWIWEVQAFFQIPGDYLAGIIRQESAYDPAAQGFNSPADYGWAQINTNVHPYTMEQAIDPALCIPWTGFRLRWAYQSYQQWDVSIAAHNSPAQAKKWFETGSPPSEQIRLYVEKIMQGA